MALEFYYIQSPIPLQHPGVQRGGPPRRGCAASGGDRHVGVLGAPQRATGPPPALSAAPAYAPAPQVRYVGILCTGHHLCNIGQILL